MTHLNLNIKLSILIETVIKQWNKLSSELVECPSLNILGLRLSDIQNCMFYSNASYALVSTQIIRLDAKITGGNAAPAENMRSQ